MKCHYHPDFDSTNACSVCSRFLCGTCSHSVKGRIYCQDCLVQGAELAAVARHPQFANYSPGRAAFFGLIPGIGAVYNHQYTKAVAHIGIFAALVLVADVGSGVFSLAAFAFWIFTIIDAYRSAEEIMRAGIAHPDLMRSETSGGTKLPIWGGALVLMGILFFLDNLNAISLRSVVYYGWPLIFIGAGVYLILSYYLKQQESDKAPPEEPAWFAPPPPAPSFEEPAAGVPEPEDKRAAGTDEES
jgi:hypothetical protein